jgi:Arc/MetJ-type ribon-helix-helix transcriptional regulator
MTRVQLTLQEKDLRYLRRLVSTGECASLSHAVRKIIREYQRTPKPEKTRMEVEKHE